MAEKRKYETPSAESLDVADVDVDVAQKSDRVVVKAKRRLQPQKMPLDLYDQLLERYLDLINTVTFWGGYYETSMKERVCHMQAVVDAVYEGFTTATKDNRLDFSLLLRGKEVQVLTEVYGTHLKAAENFIRRKTTFNLTNHNANYVFFVYAHLPGKIRDRITEKNPLLIQVYAAESVPEIHERREGIEKIIRQVSYIGCDIFSVDSKWKLTDIAPFYSWVDAVEAPVDKLHDILSFHPNIKRLVVARMESLTPQLTLPLRHENLLEITFQSFESPVEFRLFISSVLIRTPNVTRVKFEFDLPLRTCLRIADCTELPLRWDNLATLWFKQTCPSLYDSVYHVNEEASRPFFVRVPSLTRLTIPSPSYPSIYNTAPKWWTENMPSLSVLHLNHLDAPDETTFTKSLESRAPRGVLLRLSYSAPDQKKEELRSSISVKENEWNQKVVNQRVKWTKACMLIASYRANYDSVICNSVLPIIEHVAALIGTDVDDHIAFLP